jgi:hypothetical protein
VADFRRHLWRVKIFEAVAAGLIGLLLSFLLVYGLDPVWQTPGWARLVEQAMDEALERAMTGENP